MFQGLASDFRADDCPGLLLTDVQLSQENGAVGEGVDSLLTTALWNISTELESKVLHALDTEEQLREGLRLAEDGFRPTVFSATSCSELGSLAISSVWYRPLVPEEVKDRLARRQANAAVALLRFQREEKVWPLLQYRPDPRTRSYLIHRLRHLKADPRKVAAQLDSQRDDSIRRALIQILGEFTDQELPLAERECLTPRLLDWYANDPDPGIHGATAWTMRQWGRRADLQRIDHELASGSAIGNRRWYANRQGQTLVIIPPPGEIVIGSPPYETGREDGPEGNLEAQCHVRIDHSFSILTYQVTVAEFLRFHKEFNYRKQYAPQDDCPINTVSWYEAAAYCNWLNEQEGIPPEQWCYLPNDQGKYAQGMRIVPDFLDRIGYRLPTEAEWEFACRAGSVTSRYYGQSSDLDNHYAWTVQNSLVRYTVPVGSFKPNELGLFDMIGNLMDWCHDEYRPDYRVLGTRSVERPHRPNIVEDSQARVFCSSSVLAATYNDRSAYRYRATAPNVRNPFWGFRLSRTCSPALEKVATLRNDCLRVVRGPGLPQHSERIRTVYRLAFNPIHETHAFGFRAARTLS